MVIVPSVVHVALRRARRIVAATDRDVHPPRATCSIGHREQLLGRPARRRHGSAGMSESGSVAHERRPTLAPRARVDRAEPLRLAVSRALPLLGGRLRGSPAAGGRIVWPAPARRRSTSRRRPSCGSAMISSMARSVAATKALSAAAFAAERRRYRRQAGPGSGVTSSTVEHGHRRHPGQRAAGPARCWRSRSRTRPALLERRPPGRSRGRR